MNWQVTNPINPQDAPTVKIELNGDTALSIFVPVDMEHGPFNEAPLVIIGWDVIRIGQATPSTSTTNTITVSLSTYGSLVQNSGRSMNITVTGLLGSNTSSGVIPVLGHGYVFASEGVWDRNTGTIVFTALATTEPHVLYTLSFLLRNPDEGQDAPTLLNVSAGWPIQPKPLNRSSGAESPLLVHGFVRAWIQQHDPGAGANNTFVLQVESRSPVPSSPCEISIASSGDGYISGDLIVPGSTGTGFRAAFTVQDRSVASTRVITLGTGYASDVSLVPVYAGTTIPMDTSITVAEVFMAGKNYVAADLRAVHPFSGQGFSGTTTVNETDGSIISVQISNHGSDYGLDPFLSFVPYYPGTQDPMENSISGVNLVATGSTSNCLPGMIITSVGGAGEDFRASIDEVHYLTGTTYLHDIVCVPLFRCDVLVASSVHSISLF